MKKCYSKESVLNYVQNVMTNNEHKELIKKALNNYSGKFVCPMFYEYMVATDLNDVKGGNSAFAKIAKEFLEYVTKKAMI